MVAEKTAFPLQAWYQATGNSIDAQSCPVCHVVHKNGLEAQLAEAWASANGAYEKTYAPAALAHVQGGGDIFEWVKAYWMFNYAKTLPQVEHDQLLSPVFGPGLAGRHLVHVSCGSLPFSGVYFARYFKRVTLVDLDAEAALAAEKLVRALGLGNVTVAPVNGKDLPLDPNDTLLVASLVLDKPAVVANAARAGVKHLLVRATDSRPRGIFYQQADEAPQSQGYTFVRYTNPPRHIGNVTYHYALGV